MSGCCRRRLAALKYYPGRVDGRFGSRHPEGPYKAFQETQGLHPRNAVSSAMQGALASPAAKVLVHHGGRLRVEVSLKDQVLVL